MERLTDKDGKKETWNLININTNDITIKGYSDSVLLRVINKLWHYENTGLEPSEVEKLIMENERLKSDLQYAYLEENKKLAIEKLGEVLKFIYGNKWTNIELCVDNSPLKIIRNKLDTMIEELKGDK